MHPSDEDVFGTPPPPRQKGRVWLWVLLGVGGFFLLSCATCIGGLIFVGSQPTSLPVSQAELPADELQTIRDAGLLDPNESIISIATEGLFTYEQDTSFFTEEKFVFYADINQPSTHQIAPYSEIVAIEIEEPDDMFTDTYLTIELEDGSSMFVVVPFARPDGVKYARDFERAWKQAQTQ